MTVRKSILSAALAVPLASGFVSSPLRADDIFKRNNTTNLDQDSSWTEDGVFDGPVPGSDDVAVWNDIVTGANSVALGSSLSFGGIRIANPGGKVTLNIGAGNTLTLGTLGIDMSAAAADFELGSSGTLALNGAQTWSVGSGRTLTVGLRTDGSITGSGNLTISGPGTLFLNASSTEANSTFAFGSGTLTLGGGLTVRNGTLSPARIIKNAVVLDGNIAILNNKNGSGLASAIRFDGGMNIGSTNKTIALSSDNAAYAPDLGGASLNFNSASNVVGTGTLSLTNVNTGDNAGKVMVARVGAGAIQTSGLRLGSGVALVLPINNALSVNTALILDAGSAMHMGGGTSARPQTIKSLEGSGTVSSLYTAASLSANLLTIDGGAFTGTTTFSGVIQDNPATPGNGRIALTKIGSNTQILSGVNTYTGNTTVTAGTLLINGSLGGTAVTVSGGVLGGIGTIGGAATINTGGILSPGNSPGTLTFDSNLTLNNGSTYRFESGDLVDVNGMLDLNDNWTLALVGNETTFAVGGSMVIFTYTSLDGSPDLAPTFDLSNLTGLSVSPGDLSLTASGGEVVLHGLSVIPEPSVAVLLGVAGMAGLFFRRRR